MSSSFEIRPRFRRSVRIDSDFKSLAAIDGFVCPSSFRQALRFMAGHVADTGQSAFTWTGPYGGGKSSLALALACLTGAPKAVRDQAIGAIESDVVDELKDALPYFPSRWDVLPIVTEKRSMTTQLAEALDLDTAADNLAGDILARLGERTSERGLLLILDELGRGLEAAADGEGDVHLLQDIAELASRSEGRLIFVGILHQSFEEYADKLGREARDSWAKIQGRFVDISIAVTLDETIELIAEAINPPDDVLVAEKLAASVVADLKPQKSDSDAASLVKQLKHCSPLHPLTTCLLGPLSRRRFGQNQRSVFSFLQSSEPFGLQDIIQRSESKALYAPETLWDYVRANFEGAILASPDAKRWSVAVDALERCAARGGSELEIGLLKTIGILELVKDRSGISSSPQMLTLSQTGTKKKDVGDALRLLERHSEIVFRKHAGAYALYSGSDFNVEAKVEHAIANGSHHDLDVIRSLADLQPILAKRHHQETGTMRWFEISFEEASKFDGEFDDGASDDTMGRIIQIVPTNGESEAAIRKLVKNTFDRETELSLVIGFSDRSRALVDFGKELAALQGLEASHPELKGDLIARREIDSRVAELRRKIEDEVEFLFENSSWFTSAGKARALTKRQLNEELSSLADNKFSQSPKVFNELLNASAPSSNAVSARTKLMKRMVLRREDPHLGFDGKNYPAERGLYVSLLEEFDLHSKGEAGWDFQPPRGKKHTLSALWETADKLIAKSKSKMVSAQKIIEEWAKPPIGLKAGLAYIYIVAYSLSRRDQVAIYGQDVFQSRFDELCVEYLARDPSEIQLRKVEMQGLTGDILKELGDMLRLDDSSEPLGVARAVVAQYDELVPWTGRTQSLSAATLKAREILKRASDPNKLLFDDLPSLTKPKKDGSFDAKKVAKVLRDALAEMRAAYPNTLAELKSLMLNELDVRSETGDAIADLRDRADNIRQIGGDLRVDAFVGRLTQFHGTHEDMEGIAGVAANKLPRDWNDSDRERARVGIAELAGTFLKLEAMARVKGRKDRRQALALVVGRDNATLPLFGEFEVSDADRKDISALATVVDKALAGADSQRREVILAALMEVTSKYLEEENSEQERSQA